MHTEPIEHARAAAPLCNMGSLLAWRRSARTKTPPQGFHQGWQATSTPKCDTRGNN
eukprot:CAMPEP_0176002024 /NCGR_PEP_ID=MMETSP0120_2-20121206/431_1 /TAXON_ID=160619 /ORGANISM="Kryptoperidinium foliaceum, Strain CCMP 1326" /LENGTH=55 /DNA_ID=CAMNT_0017334595 /DNA_START=138 /DNA_END=302 /DNA_ORIENTATION=+